MNDTPALDNLIHQPTRLRIMAALAAMELDAEVDFTFLRKSLHLSDGNLGSHLEKLEAAGYIQLRKAFIARKPKTFIQLTRRGRRSFEEHVEALRRIVG